MMQMPMSLCLSFDDGFKIHYDVVAPLLEQHGWRGVFNVPTALMDKNSDSLSDQQVFDFRLTRNETRLFMNWDEARDLHHRGHEIYPHSYDHTDLLELERAGDINGLTSQIAVAHDQFVREMGFAPLYFCSPHNSCTKLILSKLRDNNMRLFTCCRIDCGEISEDGKTAESIHDVLISFYRKGVKHVVIMIHGIDKKLGGWHPFDSQGSFARFLDEIAMLEKSRLLKIVSYASSHHLTGLPSGMLPVFIDRMQRTLRSLVRLI